jgi:hypothetical protein
MHRGARRLCVTIMGRDGLRILSMVTVDRCANPSEHAVYLDSNTDLSNLNLIATNRRAAAT